MTRATRLADWASLQCMRLLAGLNALLFIGFLSSLLLASIQAKAESPACDGVDLTARLQREDPAMLDRIRAEASRTPNGQGLLWKVQKDDGPVSYLFGTMHVTDPRVTELTPAARQAFEQADTVVIETTDILDQAAMMASLMAEPELMMFTDGTTLASRLSAEDAALVEAGLDARGIPLGSVAKMKPWMLSAMVALPACELARKAEGAAVLDVKLAEDAKRAGKQVAGLETAVSQLRAMASLPLEFHLESLVETLRLGDRVDDVVETMIVLYQRGETGMYWPLFRAVLPSPEADGEAFADFEETMVTARNRAMALSAEPALQQGAAFIAVGALHLPGEQGLVELFRRAGYTVAPVR